MLLIKHDRKGTQLFTTVNPSIEAFDVALDVGLHLVAYYNSEAPPSIWGPASVSTAKSSQAYSKLQRQSLVQNIHDHTAHWPVCSLIDIHVS